MTPDEIAARMTGRIEAAGPGRAEAFLSSPVVHNHAAFLQWLPDGTLACAWFGGTLEGRSDIFIHLATLAPGADRLERGRPGVGRSRPVGAEPGDLHRPRRPAPPASSTPPSPAGGRRSASCASARSSAGRTASAPARRGRSTCRRARFVRAQVTLRDDGAWMLPLFLCRTVAGRALDRQPRRRRAWRRAPTAARPGTWSRCRSRPAACT